MVMTVESPLTGVSEEVHVYAGCEPEALAAAFIARHGLSRAEFERPLAEEIRRSLVEALALELADCHAARTAAEAALGSAAAPPSPASPGRLLQASAAAPATAAASPAQLPRAGASAAPSAAASPAHSGAPSAAPASAAASLVGSPIAAAGLTGGQAIAALAGAQREVAEARAAAAEGAARVRALEAEVESLRGQLAAAVRGRGGLEAAALVVADESASLRVELAAARREAEEARDAAAAAKAQQQQQLTAAAGADLSSSSSSAAAAGGGSSLGDWRQWAAEKRELLARANADRLQLLDENRRLRAALDGRSAETEARLRGQDEERSRLRSELLAAATAQGRSETELRAVYARWEEDGHRWAAERQHMAEQAQALALALQQRELALMQAQAGMGPAPYAEGRAAPTGSG
jgi:hypothetical protein